MLYVAGISITLFLSFILITKKNKIVADTVLASWLFFIAIHLSLFALIASQHYENFPYSLGLEIPLPLIHGPFLYLYTRTLTSRKLMSGRLWLHFLPALAGYCSLLPFFLLTTQEKIKIYQQDGQGYLPLLIIIFTGIVLSGIIYIGLSLFQLYQHKKRIAHTFSYKENIQLNWLFYLIIGMCLIWAIVVLANDELIFSSVVIYCLFIGYYGIKQVGIFTNDAQNETQNASKDKIKTTEKAPVQTQKYEKTALSPSELTSIHHELMNLMQKEKTFQQAELSLAQVAKELDIHPNTLSQTINRVEKKNFFDFVNGLRVEEFKLKIADPQNQQFTLLSIAFECGFNSKTSFNRNFKKVTGMSPSQYLKMVKKTS